MICPSIIIPNNRVLVLLKILNLYYYINYSSLLAGLKVLLCEGSSQYLGQEHILGI